jgi:hypothetical protein
MKIRSLAVLAVLFVASAYGAVSQTSVSVAYQYAPIVFPGARVTNVNGINNANVIVGSYYDSQDFVHGFIYRSGKYTAVNFPGSTETEVLGVNDNGDIVGTYQLPGPLNFHGFLRHGSAYASIDDPKAAIGTIAFGINRYGTIVGSYDNAHGFVYQNGGFRNLDAPQTSGEPPDTQLNGINNLGWIVGQVFTGGIWRGFWVENGHIHFIERAGSTDSEVTGVNGHGDIVGCHDEQAGFVSFFAGNYGSTAQTYPPEQRIVSCASAINYARAIVGNYAALNSQHGFLGVPALTLQVSNGTAKAISSNLLHVTASASGMHPISETQVWLNGKKIFYVSGGKLNATLNLPAGSNQRFVIQAVDTKGLIAKLVRTINVQ